MARQVYFDPFGSYTQGFDQGAGRQIQTEGAARAARAQDFDYTQLAPYRVNAAQREDQLGKVTLPYQEALAPFALDTARANRFDTQVRQATQFAPLFGVTAPLEQAYYQHYGITPTTTNVNGGPPTTELFMNGANGQPVSVGQQPNLSQNVLDYLNWQRNIQARTLQDNQQYRAGALQNAATKNEYYGVGQQARMVGAYSKYYQGQGGINGGSLFGGNMPTDLENPGYYQQPLTAPPPGQANPAGANDLQDYNLGNQ